MAGIAALAAFAFFFAVLWLWFVERASLGLIG
jgi:hypothetical protein